MDIETEIKKGNKRAAARLISMIENKDPKGAEILKNCRGMGKNARVLGLTGPPGAGKSTLADRLAKSFLSDQKKIGIIAVDPTSPITGGAFLGDRVRMSDLNGEKDVFIRSMGTRGALGGISEAVRGAVRVMEILGMDYIIIETVGVGQSEVDVAGVADTMILVTMPGTGDDIQAEKAGILEVADFIVINKADHEGLSETLRHLRSLPGPKTGTGQDNDPDRILCTVAATGEGIDELVTAINRHYDRLIDSDNTKQRQRRLHAELLDLICSRFRDKFMEHEERTGSLEKSAAAILSSASDPWSEADALLEDFIRHQA